MPVLLCLARAAAEPCKLRNLVRRSIDAKRRLTRPVCRLQVRGERGTPTVGNAARNKDLSQKARAGDRQGADVARGRAGQGIVPVGKGSEAPLVKPDDSPPRRRGTAGTRCV